MMIFLSLSPVHQLLLYNSAKKQACESGAFLFPNLVEQTADPASVHISSLHASSLWAHPDITATPPTGCVTLPFPTQPLANDSVKLLISFVITDTHKMSP